MFFVFIVLVLIQFVGCIPGHYFFLFDWKKDTVHIQGSDELTQEYLSHERETHPTDHMHKVVMAIYLIFAVGTLLFPLSGIGLFGFPIAVSLGCGLAGYVLRHVIGEQNRNTEIGRSLWRITTLFIIIGCVTIIWLIISIICVIVASSINERNSRYL